MINEKVEVIEKYLLETSRLMKMLHPEFPEQVIMESIRDCVYEQAVDTSVVLHNNYKNKKIDLTIAKITNYIEEKQPILTAYGVMYKRHSQTINPIADLLKEFMELRDIHKGMMFEALDRMDMETYERYNLYQSLDKIDANGSVRAAL